MFKRLSLFLGIFLSMFSFSKGSPLNVGDSAPTLSGTTETGDVLSLGDVYKQGYTLVYFYPKADTPGCTAQGCSLRDSYEVLTQKGVRVIGVSTDDVVSQKAFKDKYHLPFTLLADSDEKIMHAFGQAATKHASRQAYLIDKNGKVVWLDLHAKTKEQADDVLAALKKLEA